MSNFDDISSSWENILNDAQTEEGIEVEIKRKGPGGSKKASKGPKPPQASQEASRPSEEAPGGSYRVYTTEDVLPNVSYLLEAQTTFLNLEPYSEDEIKRVAETWAPVATKYQVIVPPEWAFVLAVVGITGPRWIEAYAKLKARRKGEDLEEETKPEKRKDF